MMSTGRYNLIRGLIGALFFVGVGTGCWFAFTKLHSETTQLETPKIQNTGMPKEVIIRAVSVGDVFWGGKVDSEASASKNRFVYPFSGLSSFNRQNYDAWIGSLGCAVSDSVCPGGYVPEAAKWFTAFSLANEQVASQGESGVSSTKSMLEQNGIQYFGTTSSGTMDVCEPVSLPARFKADDGSFKATTYPVALCGVGAAPGVSVKAVLSEITKYAKTMPVWVYGYAPVDGSGETTNAAQSLYRSFIDAGADIVVGAYPEKLQRVEAYNGRLIVYSVGSFISDVSGTELQRSFGLSITASIPISQSTTLWARLDCKKYKDDCIANATEQGLYKAKPSYEFGVIASDSTASSVTRLADIDWQKDMVRRLDWDNVVNKLTP